MGKLTIIKLHRVLSIAMLNYQRVRSYKQNPFISHFKCGNGVPPQSDWHSACAPRLLQRGSAPGAFSGRFLAPVGYSHRCRKCLKARKYMKIWRHMKAISSNYHPFMHFLGFGGCYKWFYSKWINPTSPRIVSRTIAYLPRLTKWDEPPTWKTWNILKIIEVIP